MSGISQSSVNLSLKRAVGGSAAIGLIDKYYYGSSNMESAKAAVTYAAGNALNDLFLASYASQVLGQFPYEKALLDGLSYAGLRKLEGKKGATRSIILGAAVSIASEKFITPMIAPYMGAWGSSVGSALSASAPVAPTPSINVSQISGVSANVSSGSASDNWISG